MKIKARVNIMRWTFLGLIAIVIAACAVEPTDIKSGLFVDAPVEGLMYESGSLIGRTDAEGRFYYETGKDVTFSIEDVVIATIEPKDFVAPFDLVSSTAFVSDTEVTNISRFIQSFDEDGDPDNGITISKDTRDAFQTFTSLAFLDFTSAGFDAISSFFTGGFRSPVAAQTHLLASLAKYDRLSVDLINLGDGFTAGMQSSKTAFQNITVTTADVNLHQYTQSNGYATILAGQIRSAIGDNLAWSSPQLEMDLAREKTRTLGEVIPYNLAVPGATSKTLVQEKTSSANLMLKELMLPIQNNWSTDYPTGVSQLEAAKLLATKQEGHERRLKLFTLWIGINDVLGVLTQGGGALLDQGYIDSYLLDPAHDLATVMTNISTTVTELSAIDDSYVFIATLPDVTKLGAIYYKEDIKSLAQFDNVSATALKNYSTAGPSDVVAIGPYAFAHYSDISGFGLSRSLASDNATLDNAISNIISNDLYSLTWTEVDFIRTRIEAINTYIQDTFAADLVVYPNVFVVDIYDMFEKLSAGSIQIGETDTVHRRFGGGFFSLDGIYPSNTGYALIAKKFIERINSPFLLSTSDAFFSTYTSYVNQMGINVDNGIGINVDPEALDLAGIWLDDPYRDYDGDGFPAGPGEVILFDYTTIPMADPSLDFMHDCSDAYISLLPEAISGTACDGL